MRYCCKNLIGLTIALKQLTNVKLAPVLMLAFRLHENVKATPSWSHALNDVSIV